jgi:hypothetical protein
MATSPNGHNNPDDQRFFGACGAAFRPETESTPKSSNADLRAVTIDIELPGKAGILRRTKFIEAENEASADPSGGPGQRHREGSKWTGANAPPTPPPSTPTTKSSTSPWKVLSVIVGAAVFLLGGGCYALALSHGDHDRTSGATTTRPTPTLTPDQSFVQDLNDHLGDELNPGRHRSDFLHWRYYHLEYAAAGHEVCAYLGSHSYSETVQQFKFKTAIGYPTDRDARIFVNIAIDDLCPQYSGMKLTITSTPATTASATPTTTATAMASGPTLGEPRTDWDRLATDTNTGAQIVCGSNGSGPTSKRMWVPSPPLNGVHIARSPCPGEPQYVKSRSTDGYMIWCVDDPLILEPGDVTFEPWAGGPIWALYQP